MYDEEDLLPISAVQHLAYCPRQCALIHIDRVWAENQWTAEGRHLHERVHGQGREARPGVLTVRGLPLRCLELGLIGKADVVEFHRCREGEPGIALPDRAGRWRPLPVEYKRGQPKAEPIDEVQLCCQALCLEEMLGIPVPEGQIFYGAERHRYDVRFTPGLRAHTRELAAQLHHLIASRTIPPATYSAKCQRCSLAGECLPRAVGTGRSAAGYLAVAFQRVLVDGDDP